MRWFRRPYDIWPGPRPLDRSAPCVETIILCYCSSQSVFGCLAGIFLKFQSGRPSLDCLALPSFPSLLGTIMLKVSYPSPPQIGEQLYGYKPHTPHYDAENLSVIEFPHQPPSPPYFVRNPSPLDSLFSFFNSVSPQQNSRVTSNALMPPSRAFLVFSAQGGRCCRLIFSPTQFSFVVPITFPVPPHGSPNFFSYFLFF